MPFNSRVTRLASELERRLERPFSSGYIDQIDLRAKYDTSEAFKEERRLRHEEILLDVAVAKREFNASRNSPLRVEPNSPIARCLADVHAIETNDPYNARLYVYRDALYEVSGPCSSKEALVLVASEADEERRQYERLHAMHFGGEGSTAETVRTRVPTAVRIAVWRRDNGKCAHCGSRDRLEYDHIIPVSEGGGNTVRNIELLCESCNRKKAANIQ